MTGNEIVYRPGEVQKRLDIQGSTLRKYVEILKREGHEIGQNKKGVRLYTEHDVMLIEELIKISKHGNITLEKSAKKLVQRLNVTQNDNEHNDMTGNFLNEYGDITAFLLQEQRKAIHEMEMRLNARSDERDAMLFQKLDQRDAIVMQNLRELQETKKLLIEFKQEAAATVDKKKYWWQFWKK